jgi:hypothetical protein
MNSTPEARRAPNRAIDLEPPLAAVEAQLGTLAAALTRQDMGAVDSAAAELHAALTAALDHFSRAARSGGVPAPLRQRLALAGGQVAAQREALARATASMDRAIDLLLPRQGGVGGLYSSVGNADRLGGQSGSLLA